jgi:peptide/nickel transport system permease protein
VAVYSQKAFKNLCSIASTMRGAPKIPIVILVMVCMAAIFAPLIAQHSPTVGSLSDRMMPPFWAKGGSLNYPMGTDALGRDMLSRVIFGTRISLSIALLAVFFAGSIGTTVGLVSGYFGGSIDVFLMRMVDIALSIPLMLLAIILAAALGVSFTNIIVVIVLLLWPYYARQVRGETLSIKERDFVPLARVANCSHTRIIWRHILPNVVPSLLVLATLQAAFVILVESSLSFLGVGIPPPAPAWGLMVGEGRVYLASAWWLSFWPGLAIFLTVLSMNLFGDWLRDRLDPKLRQI